MYITGDSGYPLEPWLLTPLGSTTTASEQAYNSSHAKIRAIIERCFGLWKSRFRCLDKSGGTLLYSAEKACQVITATAVPHNFCISRRIESQIDSGVLQRSAAIQPATVAQPVQAATAVDVRRQVVRLF